MPCDTKRPLVSGLAVALLLAGLVVGHAEPPLHLARGHFDIKMVPHDPAAGGVGQYSFTKTFHGDLQAVSAGAMLGVRTQTKGSAGYVAIEQVTGSLAGRSGSFMLQHFGLMDRERLEARVVVVPDSGTQGLAGITGTMSIDSAAGHSYLLSYAFKAEK